MEILRKNGLIVAIAVAVLALVAAMYFYIQLMDIRSNPAQVNQEEVKELVAKVGKLMVLPTDETPTVATVADPEQLKSQPFFAKAQKGDKVLIYTNSKKAILYSPETNKIVEVAPVNIGQDQQQASAPAPAEENAE